MNQTMGLKQEMNWLGLPLPMVLFITLIGLLLYVFIGLVELTGLMVKRRDIKMIRRFGLCLLGASTALLLDHAIFYGYFDLFDFLGHEYYGLIGVIVSFILLGIPLEEKEE